MKKEAYYFSHDANARNDVKLLKVRRQLGPEGYAIYFMLIEVLREQVDYKLPLTAIPDLAYDFDTSEEKTRAIICNYELFQIDGELFFSDRLTRNMVEYNEKKIKYIEAGRKGGQASVKRRLSKGQALKERKGKEIKGNKREGGAPPNLDEVVKYFIQNGYTEEAAKKAYQTYAENDWHDTRGNKVRAWKQKMQTIWFKPEHLKQSAPIKKMVL